MRTFFIVIGLLLSFYSYSQNKTRVRSTYNAEDRKYFIHKLDSLTHNMFRSLKLGPNDINTLSEKDIIPLDKEFTMNIDFSPLPYSQLRKELDEGGYIIAALLQRGLFNEFPQFERFTLTSTSKEPLIVKITYIYFDDKSIAWNNETIGSWSKINCNSNDSKTHKN